MTKVEIINEILQIRPKATKSKLWAKNKDRLIIILEKLRKEQKENEENNKTAQNSNNAENDANAN